MTGRRRIASEREKCFLSSSSRRRGNIHFGSTLFSMSVESMLSSSYLAVRPISVKRMFALWRPPKSGNKMSARFVVTFRDHVSHRLMLAARQYVHGTVNVWAEWAESICRVFEAHYVFLIVKSACAAAHDIALFLELAACPEIVCGLPVYCIFDVGPV